MKPTIPQGTRDFNAQTIQKREYIFQTIKSTFALYGFEPLETPSMENLSTLTGKYGEEGDRLIFKILNNGLQETAKHEKTKQALENVLNGKSDANLTERALRYDLTIPFARYVAMNRNDLALPYKRYQMQPVWRADKPQKGRYREFYQCDADVVGSNSLQNEAELLCIYKQVFEKLNIPAIEIKINSRKLLTALAQWVGDENKLTTITVAIDKLDKIGIEGVEKELSNKNCTAIEIEKIKKYLNIQGTTTEIIKQLQEIFVGNETAKIGLEELQTTLQYINTLDPTAQNINIDCTLARGLDYYTGIIAEVKCHAVSMGSIGGGGRYDNLTGVFDYPNVSGVGISFGVDRMYDVMEELQLFPMENTNPTQALFINFGNEMATKSLATVAQLRKHHIACELYPDFVKFDKQIKYANKKNYPYVCMIGENEMKENIIAVKNFTTGVQQNMLIEELIVLLQK